MNGKLAHSKEYTNGTTLSNGVWVDINIGVCNLWWHMAPLKVISNVYSKPIKY